MVLFAVNLSDPNYPQTTPVSIFCIGFHIFAVGEDRDFTFGTQVQLFIVVSPIPLMTKHL